MSALGQKQTSRHVRDMSALPTKADMRLAVQKCPLSANNRHQSWARPALSKVRATLLGDAVNRRWHGQFFYLAKPKPKVPSESRARRQLARVKCRSSRLRT